ncbi:MAG: NAD-glutamate dehydrogenase [Rickettsiales bacterium]|nr:NAD-glutamate dehydrogenase [Rickettsiales bacterium]
MDKKMQKLIKQVVDFVVSKKQSKDFLDFIEIFYLQNQERDFVQYKIAELYENALPSFEFFQNKKAGQFKIRLTNSAKNNYSILEILNDDMPFLVDSIAAQIDKFGIEVKNVIHPIYDVTRNKSGVLQSISANKNSKSESLMQFHIAKIDDKNAVALKDSISKLLETIRIVVEDWKQMVIAVKVLQNKIITKKKSAAEISEIKNFISWIANGSFILLGFKEFDFVNNKLKPVDSSALGVFRVPYEEFRPNVANSSVQEIAEVVKNPYIVEIVKSRYKSQIHRNANAERIRVQKFSSSGEVIGEYRIIGLFTSSAYSQSPSQIPLINGKISKVIEASEFVKGSHNYKDLVSIIEAYPRDELFQINEQDLLRISTGIVAICGRNQVRFFARKDKYNRFVSCLVFVPRERSTSELRTKICNYLSDSYKGVVVDVFVQITESNLTRLHLIIRTETVVNPDESKIESDITEMTKLWSDSLKDEVFTKFGTEKANTIFAKYKNSFSVSYANRFDARRAAIDILRIEDCLEKNSILFNLYNSSTSEKDVTELKIYSTQRELILSDVMPILESFGFSVIHEHTYVVDINIDNKVWIHYFRLNLSKSGHQFSEELKKNFEEAISLIWLDVLSVGSLNRLLVSASLNWKEVYLLRSYAKYVYQAGFRHDQEYVANILVKHSDITGLLVELFAIKFDPELKIKTEERNKKISQVADKIKASLNKVTDASHDLAIQKFFGLINATLRTNYYQRTQDGHFKGYMSFKFDCKKVPDLPLPLPHAEIFVYSNQVEGVHLRGGRVARGGLRWSDRHEDFRTEVLGLMKAQMTKNAVIVPVGSKGGFVVKKDVSKMTREEFLQEGIECYKTFLRGILDLTDNVINGKIIHPQNVVMHDGVDPYLVVAADKGTATFSDIANSVSAEYNFWLGDAFASGGSAGYDHKKMGITAKGTWISVARHFREMGVDTQTQDFTCVGIGDLSGDVFGNGMLLSPHIKMVAAFNHLHIFFDPNPDAAKSFIERQRMFNLPRSSWTDYSKSLISKGGGVFERSAKSIKISPETKQVLAIEQDELTPNDLLSAILKAPVDLLWNGGIGTYVKASDESHQDVGDRANDAIRINGADLRAKVVGEGGNLGFTQKGRVEYALNGGRINTDALDNSAGVDCSDHEVNIKIALTQALRAKKITLAERNKILESMTDEVSDLVLSDNRLQTQVITIVQSQGVNALGGQSQFLNTLEKSGLLNRKIEFLPSSKEIAKRQVDRVGLTRPELCVMLAYSKMDIYNKILASKLIDDEYFSEELSSYFPKLMQKKFAEEIQSHQLRREIIATQITNFVINRVGISFINQIAQESGFDVVAVVKSFIITCDSFGLRKVWEDVENVDKTVAAHIQTQMFLSANKLLERSMLWLLHNQVSGNLTTIVARFKKIASELSKILTQVLAEASRDSYEIKVERYVLNNVEPILARKIAAMDPIASAFDIAEILAKVEKSSAITGGSKIDLKVIAKIYFEVGTRFSLKWLRSKLSDLASEGYWQKLSSKTIIEDLYLSQMKISQEIVYSNCKKDEFSEADAMRIWIEKVKLLVERYDNFVLDLKSYPNPDMSMFVVALNRIKPLVN